MSRWKAWGTRIARWIWALFVPDVGVLETRVAIMFPEFICPKNDGRRPRLWHEHDCGCPSSLHEWAPSQYLDTHEWGVLSADNRIMVRLSEGYSYDECKRIADAHNEDLLSLLDDVPFGLGSSRPDN